MKQIEDNALKMAIKLSNHPLVETVYHPALQTTKNHHIWKRDFSGSSGLFAFSLKKLHSQNKIKKMFFLNMGTEWTYTAPILTRVASFESSSSQLSNDTTLVKIGAI